MMTTKKPSSKKSQTVLNALKQATADALEKKRLLGQYAVFWEGGEIFYEGKDAPAVKDS
ncbi:MAG: hypothetical protein PSN04_07685 [Methyloprofundus sp.]|nr:hypothetical protein [Methyloprofundus sp.]